MGEDEWRDRHPRKGNWGNRQVAAVPRTRGERGAHRACEQNAPEAPHSSGQGGSMFYVRERRL